MGVINNCQADSLERFDPIKLHGINFESGGSQMRYIYPDANHWTAGWILRLTKGGVWITYRIATDADIKALNVAVVKAHHRDI